MAIYDHDSLFKDFEDVKMKSYRTMEWQSLGET